MNLSRTYLEQVLYQNVHNKTMRCGMINLKRKKYREDHRGIVSRRIQIQSIIIFIIGLNQTTPSIVTKFIESEWKKSTMRNITKSHPEQELNNTGCPEFYVQNFQ